jgi:hypothetical protein
MVDLNYVRYSDSIEQMQPDEAELTELIVAAMARSNRKVFEKHRHAVRDAHAKSHGILKGELEVYPDMPQHLRQGIFAMPKRYPVIVRLSTAHADLESDRIPSLFGMAIKVLGVIGNKVLPEDESRNQDLLLNNIPIIPRVWPLVPLSVIIKAHLRLGHCLFGSLGRDRWVLLCPAQ